MADGEYVIRMILLMPTAAVSAVRTLLQHADFDPGEDANLQVSGYSASGNVPYTHWLVNGAYTLRQFKRFVIWLAGRLSLTVPDNWDDMTPAQKLNWINSRRSTIRQQTGVVFWAGRNDDSNPPDPQLALDLVGVKRNLRLPPLYE